VIDRCLGLRSSPAASSRATEPSSAGGLAAIESLDVTRFLRRTAEIDLPPAQRLRKLAIHAETRLTWRAEQPRAWLAHDRLYRAALDLALDPEAKTVHESRAISARAHAEALRLDLDLASWKESALRRRMMRTARQALAEAIALDPEDGHPLFLLGHHCYFDPDEGQLEAIGCYDRAIARKPDLGLALLYRAHSLHDLERWREAASAYDAVPPDSLAGPDSWRHEHLLERRAHCWWRAGETERATREFGTLLSRWEQSAQCASDAWGWDLAEAVRGSLRHALFERTFALYAREDGREPKGMFGLSLDMLEEPARS
jgi:tetratricopeptide (TPR) repeat protein